MATLVDSSQAGRFVARIDSDASALSDVLTSVEVDLRLASLGADLAQTATSVLLGTPLSPGIYAIGSEIVRLTATAVERGLYGTTAAPHTAGTAVRPVTTSLTVTTPTHARMALPTRQRNLRVRWAMTYGSDEDTTDYDPRADDTDVLGDLVPIVPPSLPGHVGKSKYGMVEALTETVTTPFGQWTVQPHTATWAFATHPNLSTWIETYHESRGFANPHTLVPNDPSQILAPAAAQEAFPVVGPASSRALLDATTGRLALEYTDAPVLQLLSCNDITTATIPPLSRVSLVVGGIYEFETSEHTDIIAAQVAALNVGATLHLGLFYDATTNRGWSNLASDTAFELRGTDEAGQPIVLLRSSQHAAPQHWVAVHDDHTLYPSRIIVDDDAPGAIRIVHFDADILTLRTSISVVQVRASTGVVVTRDDYDHAMGGQKVRVDHVAVRDDATQVWTTPDMRAVATASCFVPASYPPVVAPAVKDRFTVIPRSPITIADAASGGAPVVNREVRAYAPQWIPFESDDDIQISWFSSSTPFGPWTAIANARKDAWTPASAEAGLYVQVSAAHPSGGTYNSEPRRITSAPVARQVRLTHDVAAGSLHLDLGGITPESIVWQQQSGAPGVFEPIPTEGLVTQLSDIPSSATTVRVLVTVAADPYDVATNGADLQQLQQTLLLMSNVVALKQTYADVRITGASRVGGRLQVSYTPHAPLVGNIDANVTYAVEGVGNAITLFDGRLSGAPERAIRAGETLRLVPVTGGDAITAVARSAIVPVTYQWQMSATGDLFHDITGETTPALHVTNAYNGTSIRCNISPDPSGVADLVRRTKHTVVATSNGNTRFQIDGDDVPTSSYLRMRVVSADTYVDITRTDASHVDTAAALPNLNPGDVIYMYARHGTADVSPAATLEVGGHEALVYLRRPTTTADPPATLLTGEANDASGAAVVLTTPAGGDYALCLAASSEPHETVVTATTCTFWHGTAAVSDTREGFVVAGADALHLFSWDPTAATPPVHEKSLPLGGQVVRELRWLSATAVAVLTTAGSVLLWKVDAYATAEDHHVLSSDGGSLFIAAILDQHLVVGTAGTVVRHGVRRRQTHVTDTLRVTAAGDNGEENLTVTIARADNWERQVDVARSDATLIAQEVRVLTANASAVMARHHIPIHRRQPIFVARFTMHSVAVLPHIGFDAVLDRVAIAGLPAPAPLLLDVPSGLEGSLTATLRQGSDVVVAAADLRVKKLLAAGVRNFTLSATIRKRPVFASITGTFTYDGTTQRDAVTIVYDGTPTTLHEEEVRTGSRIQIIGVGTYVQTIDGLTVTLRNVLRGYPLTVSVGSITLAEAGAGSTTATVELTYSSSHYTIEHTSIGAVPVTITPKALTVSGTPQNLDRVYDGTLERRNVDTQLVTSGIVGEDDVAVRTQLTYEDYVGTGTVTLAHILVGTHASNYAIPTAAVVSTATTSPRSVVVDYEQLDFGRTYDGTAPTAFTVETDFVSLQQVLPADRPDVELEMVGVALGRDAGTYSRDLQFLLAGTKATYYALQTSTITRDIVVRPVAISVPDVEFVKVYDGTTSLPTDDPTVELGDVIDGDTVQLVVSRGGAAALGSSEVGGTTVADVTVSLDNANYVPASPIVVRGFVTPLPVTVTVGNIAGTITRPYDGSDQLLPGDPTFSPAPAFIAGDDVSPSLQVQAPSKNVGTYDLTTPLDLTLLRTDTTREIAPLLAVDPRSAAWASGDPTYDNDRGRVDRSAGDVAYGDKVLLFGVAEDRFGFERFTLRGDLSPDLVLPRHGTVHLVTPRAYPMRLSAHIDGIDPQTGTMSVAGESDWLVGRSPVHVRFGAASDVPARGAALAQSYDRPVLRLSHDPLAPLEIGDTIALGDDVTVTITSRFDDTSDGWPRDLTFHLGLAATAVQTPTPTSLTVSGHALPLGAYNATSPRLAEATSLTLELRANQRATGVVEQVQEKDSGLLATAVVGSVDPPPPYVGGDFFLISAASQAQGNIYLLPSARYVSLTSADAAVQVVRTSRSVFGEKIAFTVTRPALVRTVQLALSVSPSVDGLAPPVEHAVQVVFQNSDDVPLSVRVRSTSAAEFVAGVALEDSGALPVQVSPVDPRYHVLTVQCRGDDREHLYYFNEDNTNMGGRCLRSNVRAALTAFDTGYPHESTFRLPGHPRPRKDQFGASVTHDGTDLFVGAPGSSRVFRWGEEVTLFDERPTLHNFGKHVARSADRVVVRSGSGAVGADGDRASVEVQTTLVGGTARMIFYSPISDFDPPSGVRELVTPQNMRFPIDRISSPVVLGKPGPHSTVSLHAATRIITPGAGILERSVAHGEATLVVGSSPIEAGATTVPTSNLYVNRQIHPLPLELVHDAFPAHVATLDIVDDEGTYSLTPAPLFNLKTGTVLRIRSPDTHTSARRYTGFLHETPPMLRSIMDKQDVLVVRKNTDDIVARCTPSQSPVAQGGFDAYAPMHVQIPAHPFLKNALALDSRLPATGARCMDMSVHAGGMARIYHSDAVLNRFMSQTGQIFRYGSQCVPLDRNLRPVRANLDVRSSYMLLGIVTDDSHTTFYDVDGAEIVFPVALTPTSVFPHFEFIYRTSPAGLNISTTIVTGHLLETVERGLAFPIFFDQAAAEAVTFNDVTPVTLPQGTAAYLANLAHGTETHLPADDATYWPLWGPEFAAVENGDTDVPLMHRYSVTHVRLEHAPRGDYPTDSYYYHLVPEKDLGPPRRVEVLHEFSPGHFLMSQVPTPRERVAYLHGAYHAVHARQAVVRDLAGSSNGFRRVQCEDPRLNQTSHARYETTFSTVAPVRAPRLCRDLRVPVLLQPTPGSDVVFVATIRIPGDEDLRTLVGGVTDAGYHIAAVDADARTVTFDTSPAITETTGVVVLRRRGKTFALHRAVADQRVSRRVDADPDLAWDDMEFYGLADGPHATAAGDVRVQGHGTLSHRTVFTNHNLLHHAHLMAHSTVAELDASFANQPLWDAAAVAPVTQDPRPGTTFAREIAIEVVDGNIQARDVPFTTVRREETYVFALPPYASDFYLVARWVFPSNVTSGNIDTRVDASQPEFTFMDITDIPADATHLRLFTSIISHGIQRDFPVTNAMSPASALEQTTRFRMSDDDSDVSGSHEYVFGTLDEDVASGATSLKVSGIRYGGGESEELHTILRTSVLRIGSEYIVLVPTIATAGDAPGKRTTVVRGAMGTTAVRHAPGSRVHLLGATSLLLAPLAVADLVNDEPYRTTDFDFDRPVHLGTPLDFLDISTRLHDDVFYDRDGVLLGLTATAAVGTQVAATHPNWNIITQVVGDGDGVHIFCDDHMDPLRTGSVFRVGSSPASSSKTFRRTDVPVLAGAHHMSLVPANAPHLRFRAYLTTTHVTIRSASGLPWSEDVELFVHDERITGTALTDGDHGRDGQLHVYDRTGLRERSIRAPYNAGAPTHTRLTTSGGEEEIYLDHPVDLTTNAFLRGPPALLGAMRLRTATGSFQLVVPDSGAAAEHNIVLALTSDAPDDPVYSVVFGSDTVAGQVVEFVQRQHERFVPAAPSTPSTLAFVPEDVDDFDTATGYVVAGVGILSTNRGSFLCEQPHEVSTGQASMVRVVGSHLASVHAAVAFRELTHFKPYLSTRIALDMSSSDIEVGQVVRVVDSITQLVDAIDAAATIFPVAHPHLLSAGMVLRVQDEVVRVEKVMGTTVHVRRAMEATVAAAHPAGRSVVFVVDSRILEKTTTGAHGSVPAHDVLRLNTPTQQSFSAGATVVLNRGYPVRTAERLLGAGTTCSHWLNGSTLYPVEALPGNETYRVVRGAVAKAGFALTTATELAAPLRETFAHAHTDEVRPDFLPAAGDALRVGRETMALDSTQPGEAGVYRVARDDPRSHVQGAPMFHGAATWNDLAVTTETLELEETHGIDGDGTILYRGTVHGVTPTGATDLNLTQTGHFFPDPDTHADIELLEPDGGALTVTSSSRVHGLDDKRSLVWFDETSYTGYQWKSFRRNMWTTPVTQNLDGGGVEVDSVPPSAAHVLCRDMGPTDVAAHVEPELAALLRAHDHIRIDTEWVRVHAVDVDRSIAYVVRSARASHSKFVSIARAPENRAVTQWSVEPFATTESRVTVDVGTTCDWYTGLYSAGLDSYFGADVNLLEPVECTLAKSGDGRWMVTSSVLRAQQNVALHLSSVGQITSRAIQNDADLVAYLTTDEYFPVSSVRAHLADASFDVAVDGGARRSTLRRSSAGEWSFDDELLGTPLPQGSPIEVSMRILTDLANDVQDSFEGLVANPTAAPPFSGQILRALELWTGPRRHLLQPLDVGATQLVIDNVFTSNNVLASLVLRVHPRQTTFAVDDVQHLAPGMVLYLSKEQVRIVSVDGGERTLVVERGYGSSGSWWHLEGTPLRQRRTLAPGEHLQVYLTADQMRARDSYTDVGYGNGSAQRVLPVADTQDTMTIQSIDDTRTALNVVRGGGQTSPSPYDAGTAGHLWVGYLHRAVDAAETKLFVRDHKTVLRENELFGAEIDMPGERLAAQMTFKLGGETLTVADSDNLGRIVSLDAPVGTQLVAGMHLRTEDGNIQLDDPRFSYATYPKKWSYVSGDGNATATVTSTGEDELWRLNANVALIGGYAASAGRINLGYTNEPNSYEPGMENTGHILPVNLISQEYAIDFAAAKTKALATSTCVAFSWNKDDWTFFYDHINLNANYYQDRGVHGNGWKSYVINKMHAEIWARDGSNVVPGQVVALVESPDEMVVTAVQEHTVYDGATRSQRSSWKISINRTVGVRHRPGSMQRVLGSRSLGRLLFGTTNTDRDIYVDDGTVLREEEFIGKYVHIGRRKRRVSNILPHRCITVTRGESPVAHDENTIMKRPVTLLDTISDTETLFGVDDPSLTAPNMVLEVGEEYMLIRSLEFRAKLTVDARTIAHAPATTVHRPVRIRCEMEPLGAADVLFRHEPTAAVPELRFLMNPTFAQGQRLVARLPGALPPIDNTINTATTTMDGDNVLVVFDDHRSRLHRVSARNAHMAVTPPLVGKRGVGTLRRVVETLAEDTSFFLMTETQVLGPCYKSQVAAGSGTAAEHLIAGNLTLYSTAAATTVATQSGTTRALPDFQHSAPEPWSAVRLDQIQADQRNLRLTYAISLIDGDRFAVGGRVCTVEGQNVMTDIVNLEMPQGQAVRVHVGSVVEVLEGSTNLFEITTGDSQLAAVQVGESLHLVDSPQDSASPTKEEIMAISRGVITVVASDVFTNKMTVETSMPVIALNMLIVRERQTLTASLPGLGEVILPKDTVQQNQPMYYRDGTDTIRTVTALLVNFGHHMHLASELPPVQTHSRSVTVKTATDPSGTITGTEVVGDFDLLPIDTYDVSAPQLFPENTTVTVAEERSVTFSALALRDGFGEPLVLTRRLPTDILVVKLETADLAVEGTMFGDVVPAAATEQDSGGVSSLLSTLTEQVLMPLTDGHLLPGPRGRALRREELVRIHTPAAKTVRPLVGVDNAYDAGAVRVVTRAGDSRGARLTIVSASHASTSSYDASRADGSAMTPYRVTGQKRVAGHRISTTFPVAPGRSGELMAVRSGAPYVTIPVAYTVQGVDLFTNIITLSDVLTADAAGTYEIGITNVSLSPVGRTGATTLHLVEVATTTIAPGTSISGAGIPENTTVISVDPITQITTVSNALTDDASGVYRVGTVDMNASTVGRAGSDQIRVAGLEGVVSGEAITGTGIPTTSNFSLRFALDRKVPYVPGSLPLLGTDVVFRQVTTLHKGLADREIVVPGITVPAGTTHMYTSAGEAIEVTAVAGGGARIERTQHRAHPPDGRIFLRGSDSLSDVVRLHMDTAHTLDVGDDVRLDEGTDAYEVLAEHGDDVLIGIAALDAVPRTVRPAVAKTAQLLFDAHATKLRSDFQTGFGAHLAEELLPGRALVASRDATRESQPTYLADLATGALRELPRDTYRAARGILSCRDAGHRDVVLYVRDLRLEKLTYDTRFGWVRDAAAFPANLAMTRLHQASEHAIIGEHPAGTLVAYDHAGVLLFQRNTGAASVVAGIMGTFPRMTLFLRNGDAHVQTFGAQERRSFALLGTDAGNYDVSVVYEGGGLATGVIDRRSLTMTAEDRTIDYRNSTVFPGGVRRLQHTDVTPAEIFELTLPEGTLSSAQPGDRTGTFDLQSVVPVAADGFSGDIANYDVPSTLQLAVSITTRLAEGRTLLHADPAHFTGAAPLRLDAAQLLNVSIAGSWGAETIELLPDGAGFSTVQLSVLRTNVSALRPATKFLVELNQDRSYMDTSVSDAYSLPITIPAHLGTVYFRRGGAEFDLNQANEYLEASDASLRSQIKGLVGPMAVDFGDLGSIPTSMEFYGEDIYIRGTGALAPAVARSIRKVRSDGTASLDLTGVADEDVRAILSTLECVEGDFRLTLGSVGGDTPVHAGFLNRLLGVHDDSRCTLNGSLHLRLDATSAAMLTSSKVVIGSDAALTLTIEGAEAVHLQLSGDDFPRQNIAALRVESGADVTVAYATE